MGLLEKRVSKDENQQTNEVDFSSLILGFSSAALYYMGQVPLKDRKPAEINLPLSRQNIEIIAMLQEKTKGNRTGDEDNLITQLLTDLKLKFAAASKAKK